VHPVDVVVTPEITFVGEKLASLSKFALPTPTLRIPFSRTKLPSKHPRSITTVGMTQAGAEPEKPATISVCPYVEGALTLAME
jgi:hypothetical protein